MGIGEKAVVTAQAARRIVDLNILKVVSLKRMSFYWGSEGNYVIRLRDQYNNTTVLSCCEHNFIF